MRRMLSSLVVFVSLVAATTAQDSLESPLGRLVDISGRRLHLHCTDSGSPTVVIEAGASSFVIDFSMVQPEVSKTTRVRHMPFALAFLVPELLFSGRRAL